jgi:aminopeptidase 2
MTENWDKLVQRLPAGLSMLGSMVTICTSSFTSQKDYDRVKEFFDGKSTKGFTMSLAQSLESIQAKSAWLGRDRDDVASWLKQNGYGSKNIKSEL